MRIIAGEWRGRKLVAPPGDLTRPTADRTRETLFNMLASRIGSFEGLAVLDLFAGSGALGLEALSRGAASCLFVEQDARAVEAISSIWRSRRSTSAASEAARAGQRAASYRWPRTSALDSLSLLKALVWRRPTVCAVTVFFLSVCALGSSLFSLLGHALAALASKLVSSD